MTLMDAVLDNTTPDKKRRTFIIASLCVAGVIAITAFMTWNLSAEYRVNQLFAAIEKQDFPQAFGIDPSLLFQGEQPDVDAQQSLRDFILKLKTDLLSVLLLRRQNLVGQLPQTLLQLQGFPQQPGVVFPAAFEGGFYDSAP